MAAKRQPTPTPRSFAELVLDLLAAQRRFFHAPKKTEEAQNALIAAKELETRAYRAAHLLSSAPEETRLTNHERAYLQEILKIAARAVPESEKPALRVVYRKVAKLAVSPDTP